LSTIDEAERKRRIALCVFSALEANLGKNVATTLLFHFRNSPHCDLSEGEYGDPEKFITFLRGTLPSAAPTIENEIIKGIKSSFILPKASPITSLSEAVALAKVPSLLEGDVEMNEVEARIVKCVQYALRDTFSEGTVQIIFGKFEKTTKLGLKSVATRPEEFLTFLKSLFGPAVKNIEHVFLREMISEFSEEFDLRPSSFVDMVSRLRMRFVEREMDWTS
jgi:hypothetical protein